jgi:mono/diheme cytochrome c family protein
MLLRKLLQISLAVLFMYLFGATQQASVNNVPIQHISPADGEKMYATYCAVCHGTDGTGTGPAATALKNPPTDLSTSAKFNHGKFPFSHVQQSILGDASMTAEHGHTDMPVWRGLFYSLCSGRNMEEAEVHQRVVNLSQYIGTLQR